VDSVSNAITDIILTIKEYVTFYLIIVMLLIIKEYAFNVKLGIF